MKFIDWGQRCRGWRCMHRNALSTNAQYHVYQLLSGVCERWVNATAACPCLLYVHVHHWPPQ
jgi:hypothetical protein